MKKSVLAIALTTTVLGGCVNAVGRPEVVSQGTISNRVHSVADSQTRGTFKLFAETAVLAYPSDTLAPPDPRVQLLFLRRGFDVIETQCVAYLDGKADRQRSINVVRDTFGPIAALTSGIIGLTDGGDAIDNDVLAALGLTTTAATAAFEIYERRFLFDAKNVNSVKRLVIRALNEDSEARLASLTNGDLNWTSSIKFLRKNQEICNPHEILELVQSAIANGKIEPIKRPIVDGDVETADDGDGKKVRYEGVRVAPIE